MSEGGAGGQLPPKFWQIRSRRWAGAARRLSTCPPRFLDFATCLVNVTFSTSTWLFRGEFDCQEISQFHSYLKTTYNIKQVLDSSYHFVNVIPNFRFTVMTWAYLIFINTTRWPLEEQNGDYTLNDGRLWPKKRRRQVPTCLARPTIRSGTKIELNKKKC